MQSKTRGIVLHHINYSDTSIIAYIYTEQFGRKTFMIKGAKRKKASIRANLFQPLFLLDLDMNHNPNKNFQVIKDVKISPVLETIPNDMAKRAISLFVAEILYRAIKEEEANSQLFGYIFHSVELLDHMVNNTINFHLFFLVGLLRHLGFFPINNFSPANCCFDMLRGKFVPGIPPHNHFMGKDLGALFSAILRNNEGDFGIVGINNMSRIALLEKIIEYYQIHLDGFPKIKSFDVFKELFH